MGQEKRPIPSFFSCLKEAVSGKKRIPIKGIFIGGIKIVVDGETQL
jgi:hypothetical protein